MSAQPLLQEAAVRFQSIAESCLLEVRDQRQKYEDATSCKRLKDASLAYISLGGGTPSTPDRIALIAERGRTMAWMARALSAGAPAHLW